MSFQSVYVSISDTNFNSINILKRRISLSQACKFPTHFCYNGLVERYSSYSLSLKQSKGTELTVSRPHRAIHPEVQKWHRAAVCARWWRLPPTLSWSTAGQTPFPQSSENYSLPDIHLGYGRDIKTEVIYLWTLPGTGCPHGFRFH